MSQGAESMVQDIPEEYLVELQGMVAGCKAINPQTDVQLEHLYALNFGIDYLLSHVYPGVFGKKKRISPFLLKPPIACNAFSIRGESVADGRHYFGRDWQFNTLGYLQYTACLIIVNPLGIKGKTLLPIVNATAPGIIGSPAAMNSEGLAIGVDMFPTMLCSPGHPGLNGLLLARDSMHHCSKISCDKDADKDKNDLVTHMRNTNRGVSYIYPAADGKSGNACSIEAGANIGDKPFPYYDFLPEEYKKDAILKKIKDFLDHIEKLNKDARTPRPVKGLMMRQANFQYPQEPLVEINREMWKIYDENFGKKLVEFAKEFSRDLKLLCHCKLIRLIRNLAAQFYELFRKPLSFDPYCFGERGFITRLYQEDNCPGPFYFAPQRETSDDLFVASNLGITPQMRLTAMSEWVTLLEGNNMQSQWRYDVLNDNLLRAIAAATVKKGSKITAPAARNLVDYLADYGDFPGYHNPDNEAWQTIPVDGMVSLFELTEKTIECHFGFYGDEWVKLTLPNYILK